MRLESGRNRKKGPGDADKKGRYVEEQIAFACRCIEKAGTSTLREHTGYREEGLNLQ